VTLACRCILTEGSSGTGLTTTKLLVSCLDRPDNNAFAAHIFQMRTTAWHNSAAHAHSLLSVHSSLGLSDANAGNLAQPHPANNGAPVPLAESLGLTQWRSTAFATVAQSTALHSITLHWKIWKRQLSALEEVSLSGWIGGSGHLPVVTRHYEDGRTWMLGFNSFGDSYLVMGTLPTPSFSEI
jgi:hypothetical protein